MVLVTKRLKNITPMSKEKAEELRNKFKNNDNIDFSDIPELDDSFFATAKVVNYANNIKNIVVNK